MTRMTIKQQILIVVVACVVLAAAAWIFTPPAASAPQTIRFSGFTNGVVGAIAPVYATLTTNRAAVIQRWLAAGTNGARFAITNQQSCAIYLHPVGRICNAGPHPANEETPVLNAPDWSGLRLAPCQVATIQVAVLEHQGPWRLRLYYSRDSCTDSFARQIGRLPEELRALITRKPVRVQMYTIESDWIDK
jgi:hypothetical protein